MATVRKTQGTRSHVRSGRRKSFPSRPASRAAEARPNGIVIPTNPRYRNGGCTIIRTWFWRSGFGPGPSGGGTATVPNGCDGPASRNAKNAPQASQTAVAHGVYSGWRSPRFHVARATKTPRIAPQKRIDPSSEDHRLTTATQSGTCREPTWATYATEKSRATSAYTMSRLASTTSAEKA